MNRSNNNSNNNSVNTFNNNNNDIVDRHLPPDGPVTTAGVTFWIIGLGIPLFFLSGRWFLGLACILFGLALAVSNVMTDIDLNKQQQQQGKSRFETMHARNVVDEIKKAVTATAAEESEAIAEQDYHNSCSIILRSALGALARKLNSKECEIYDVSELELSCQEGALIVLEYQKDKSENSLIGSALFLMALVARNVAVRNECRHSIPATTFQHQRQPHSYSHRTIELPIHVMRFTLRRVQGKVSGDDFDDEEEHEASVAEIQRKACLWIGALADGDEQLASLLVNAGALEAILNAIDWFRHHCEVNNWGLWAIFNLCLEHDESHMEFVRVGGLRILCRSIALNADESVEVCRHGLAILFDLLRQRPDCDPNGTSVAKTSQLLEIRRLAIAASLHDAVRKAMKAYPDSMEIMGMGTEMLLSTGYEGDIPLYLHPGE